MSDREQTVIPTHFCVVVDGEQKLHFRFPKDQPFGSPLHDKGESIVHEIEIDFSEVGPEVANAFRVAFEMDTLADGSCPMEQLLEFMFGLGYRTRKDAEAK